MGMFITFEGIEGVGKTTQLLLLADWLRERGKEVCVTHEPGDTPLGQGLRELLLSSKNSPGAEAELLLYLADRVEHVKKVISPALGEDKVVLCDRYHDSTLAYQGYGRGINIAFIRNCFAEFHFPLPDITFLLDCPVEIALFRIKGRTWDRMEKEDISFHKRVRKGFLKLAETEPKRFKVIDATGAVQEVQAKIREYLLEYGV